MSSERRCNRRGCANEGASRPVLVLEGGPGTPRIRAALGMLVCKGHETPIAETYVNVLVRWEALCAQYVDAWKRAIVAGLVDASQPVGPPVLALARVVYIAHDAPESLAFADAYERLQGAKPETIEVEDGGGVRKVPLIRGGN